MIQLHCTIINTSHRRPHRRPFSYAELITSDAFRTIEQVASQGTTTTGERRGRQPLAVDLGEWGVNEIQICKMGSWGPEGEYVCVGNISLV